MYLLQRATSFSALHSLVMAVLMLATTGLAFSQAMPSKNPTPKTEAVRPEGRVFESAEGGFRIWLPKDFRDPIKQNRVIAGKGVNFPAFLSLSDRGSFTISPVEPPSDLVATPELLKKVATGEFEITKTKTERERVLARKGETGIEVYGNGMSGPHVRQARLQLIAAPHRWFEVAFLSLNQDFRDEPDIAAVFDSFEILPATMIKAFTPEPLTRLPYASADGTFKLELPPGFQLPIDQTAQLGSVPGMKISQFLSSGPSGLVLMTRFFEIRGMDTKAQIAEFRERIAAEIIQTMNGRILGSKPVVREGIHGRELRFTGEIAKQAFNGRGLIFGQVGKVYMFIYLSPSKETLDSPETDRFFDSITLNPR